jgi:predicted esterase YcpF (UPF0227 family)
MRTIEQATGEDSGVRKVSLLSCSLGGDYAEKLLLELRKKGVLCNYRFHPYGQ